MLGLAHDVNALRAPARERARDVEHDERTARTERNADANENSRRGFFVVPRYLELGQRLLNERRRRENREVGGETASDSPHQNKGGVAGDDPLGLSLFAPGRGALACNGGGDVCLEILRRQQAEIVRQNIEAVSEGEWALFWAYSGGQAVSFVRWLWAARAAGAAARGATGGLRIVEQVDDIVEIAGKIGEHEIRVLANMSREGGTLFLRQAHIQGPGAGKVGVKGLLDAAKEFGRSQGASKVVIEGAKRTTGAGNQRGAVPRVWEILVD